MRKLRVPKPKIRTVYYPADAVREVAEDLIAEHFGVLKGYNIEWVFRTREDENSVIQPPRVVDAKNPGKMSCASVVDQKLHHGHFRAVVNGNWWDAAKKDQREALVFHLLCHAWPKEGKPTLVQHDFQGFVSEIRHCGPWSKELAEFEDAMKQQTLPLEAGAAAAK